MNISDGAFTLLLLTALVGGSAMLCCVIVAYRVKGQSKRSPVRIAKDIWLTAMRPAHEFIVEPEVMELPLVRKTIVGVRITTIVLVIVLFTVSLVAHDCLHCSNVALSAS